MVLGDIEFALRFHIAGRTLGLLRLGDDAAVGFGAVMGVQRTLGAISMAIELPTRRLALSSC